MRHLLLLLPLTLLAAGCRSGPQPPAASDPPTPGYERVKAPNLSFAVDLPEGWQVVRTAPQLAVLERRRPRALRWQLYLWEASFQPASKGEEEKQRAIDKFQNGLLPQLAPAGAQLHVMTSEVQRTGWLPGRLVQAEAAIRRDRRLVVAWIGVYRERLYAIGGVSPPAAQLELRETLDHAIASLRPKM